LQFIQRALAEKLPVPKKIRRKLLPDLPNTVSLLEGDLKFRTYNSLKKAGFVDQPLKLSGLTIDDLLQLPNFGRDSLFDLLTFLEPFFTLPNSLSCP
jgi:DNA-directed RNA polymerase alpha subunit